MNNATKEAMGALHGALANTLTDMLTKGETTVDKDGEVVTLPPSAATLSVIRQFLKDNGIEALATPGSPIASLASALPFPGGPLTNEEDAGQRH